MIESAHPRRTVACSLALVVALCLPTDSAGHGLLTDPRQRGALRVKNRLVGDISTDAPFDYSAHFPSGDKSKTPGAGTRSVIRAAGREWTPYQPFDSNFRWRAGVCGDEIGGEQEHLKGGKYFFPAEDPVKVREYTQGEVIDMEANIVAHHNGYFEFYICNVDKCGNDISRECFESGNCQQLLRAPSYCDEANSEDCGPIDTANPGRWYLPCGPFPTGQILYGGAEKGSMKYKLPDDLQCEHCVIQWYWTSANTCNPPGVVDYFEGKDAPRWRQCKGQGNARGGYTRVQRECGGERFSEEYWQCADVKIHPHHGTEAQVHVEESHIEDPAVAQPASQPVPLSDTPTSPTSVSSSGSTFVTLGRKVNSQTQGPDAQKSIPKEDPTLEIVSRAERQPIIPATHSMVNLLSKHFIEDALRYAQSTKRQPKS